MQAYMKGVAPFLGIKTGMRRQLQKEVWKDFSLPARGDWQAFAAELFSMPEREYHYAALELLQTLGKQWQGDEHHLWEWLIGQKPWWDTVDVIAIKLAGPFFLRFPAEKIQTAQRWVASKQMWLRRAAIIFQNGCKTKTDEALLFYCIKKCKDEGDFFIRKGIGWALREYAKTNGDAVIRLVEQENISGLSRREALKHL